MPRQINTRSSGLSHHMTRYNITDARMDNPHLPARELPSIVRAARLDDRDRARPLVNRRSK